MSLSAAVATPTSLPMPVPVTPATVQAWPTHRDAAAARLPAADRRPGPGPSLRGRPAERRPRKNGWPRAEARGDATPYAMPHLLGRALGSADEAGAGLYDYVIDHLGDEGGVAILDETGFQKKGTHSAGVARQYSGTAGQIANCQVGVFLAYAGARGYTLVDRALYLPRAWTDDPAQRQAVGLAPGTPFAPSRNWPAGCGRGPRPPGCRWPG